jgi:glycosyltransferase involved in cell wall biosynthesis
MPLGIQQGGAESLLMHLLSHGMKRYDLLCVFLQAGPLIEEARTMGYHTRLIPITRLSDPGNFLATVLKLRRWLQDEKPALVFSWMAKAHLYVAPAAVGLGVKTMWFQHGIPHNGTFDRWATQLPTSGVLCCSITAKIGQDRLKPKRRSFVCYPGVKFASSEPIPALLARTQLGLNPNATIVGMVARLERWKGVHVFIKAAQIASAAHPGTYFFVVGGPHSRDLAYAAEIRSMAAKSGLGDRLILANQRPASEVPLWQASADFIVHPVTGEEPFGMAVAEAMGMGKVVIASDAGGPSEIIEDGVNGFLVRRGDAEELGTTIIRLLKDPRQLEWIGANAFTRGRTFSVSAFADRVDELLTEALR